MHMDVRIYGTEGMIQFRNLPARLELRRHDGHDEALPLTDIEAAHDGALPVRALRGFARGETVENPSDARNGLRVRRRSMRCTGRLGRGGSRRRGCLMCHCRVPETNRSRSVRLAPRPPPRILPQVETRRLGGGRKGTGDRMATLGSGWDGFGRGGAGCAVGLRGRDAADGAKRLRRLGHAAPLRRCRPDGLEGPGAHRYPVHGIDVSRYRPDRLAHGAGQWRGLCLHQGDRGRDRVDPAFAAHWQGAGGRAWRAGAYHFHYWCGPAAAQAAWFIANVPRERGALPPILDLEWNSASPTCATYRPAPESCAPRCRLAQHRRAALRQTPVIYTTPDFWERNELWRLQGAEMWLRAVADHPSRVYPGEDWTFWQYSGTGLVPGVEGPVDVNAFAGSPQDWARWMAGRAL
jgi:lysozyme